MPLPDAVILQWHPTADWNAPLIDSDWTTISLPITHLWYRRGYKRGQQRVEAGEFEVTFRDPTRSMDPTKVGTPNYRKGRRQFRLRVTVGATTYTVFRGITSGWQPDWTLGDFRVTMRGTDRSPALEGVFVPSVFEQVVRSLSPLWWVHGGLGSKPDPVGVPGQYLLPNVGTEARPALTVGIDPKGQPVLPYDSSPSLVPNPSSSTGAFGQFSATVPTAIAELTAPFSIAAAFVTDGTGAIYGQGPSGASDIVFGASWGAPTDMLSIYIADGSATPPVFLHSDNIVTDGAPHFATGNWDGQVLRLKTDLAAQKVGPLLSPPVPAPRVGSALIGNIPDTTRPFPGRIGHLLAWDYSLSPSQIADLHSAALTPWQGLRSDQVIAKVLDYVGLAASERNLEVGQETMGPSRCEASALVCCERPAATETGLFFFDREGKAAFYARNHVGLVGAGRDTNPTLISGRLKLQDLTINMDERTYYTVGKAYVAAADPIEVVYRHANADVDGDLVWSPETEYADSAAALAGAQRAVGAGQAVPHFTGARTLGEETNWAQILTRDVWDTLTIYGHPGGVEESQSSRILEVEHEMDGLALTWTCSLTLEAI